MTAQKSRGLTPLLPPKVIPAGYLTFPSIKSSHLENVALSPVTDEDWVIQCKVLTSVLSTL